MFVYCVRVLQFAEGVAYKRIQAARAARAQPEVLEALRCGDLHLTAVSLLAPKLSKESCAELIRAARHKTAEDVKQLIADREPRPAPAASIRRIPEATQPAAPLTEPACVKSATKPSGPVPAAAPPVPAKAFTEPLGAERYQVQFTADKQLFDQIRELQALMRHQIPDGDLGKILARGVAVLLDKVRKQKFAQTPAPKPVRPTEPKAPSRHIPAAIRRAVWQRDAGQCTYVSAGGRRCNSKDFLEFDHVDAWIRSKSHSTEEIVLRCRAHNQQRARIDFGERHMARFQRRGRTPTGFESSSPTSQ